LNAQPLKFILNIKGLIIVDDTQRTKCGICGIVTNVHKHNMEYNTPTLLNLATKNHNAFIVK